MANRPTQEPVEVLTGAHPGASLTQEPVAWRQLVQHVGTPDAELVAASYCGQFQSGHAYRLREPSQAPWGEHPGQR
jgi:hypothetical protein